MSRTKLERVAHTQDVAAVLFICRARLCLCRCGLSSPSVTSSCAALRCHSPFCETPPSVWNSFPTFAFPSAGCVGDCPPQRETSTGPLHSCSKAESRGTKQQCSRTSQHGARTSAPSSPVIAFLALTSHWSSCHRNDPREAGTLRRTAVGEQQRASPSQGSECLVPSPRLSRLPRVEPNALLLLVALLHSP